MRPSLLSSGHSKQKSQNTLTKPNDKPPPSPRSPSSKKHAPDTLSDHASLSRAKQEMLESEAGAKAPPIPSPTKKTGDGFGSEKEKVIGREGQQKEPNDSEKGKDARQNIELDKSHGGIEASADMKNKNEAELARLKAAVNAQMRLTHERERLNRGLVNKTQHERPIMPASAKSRVSPINEEEAVSPSLLAAFATPAEGPETASTESVDTVKGSAANTPALGTAARTPSYPFPFMKWGNLGHGSHRPFTTLSPTVPSQGFDKTRDSSVSGSVTPASQLTFLPPGASPSHEPVQYPSPNLYDLSLMLSAEPGLDGWWATVVEVMRDIYQAERITLAVPADSTDIENVPWGQKATYNAREEDELSLTYLPRGSSLVPSSTDTGETSPRSDLLHGEDQSATASLPSHVRPGLTSRHSFTSYEEQKKEPGGGDETARSAAVRPSLASRSKSYMTGSRSDQIPRYGSLQNAQLNLQSLEDHLAKENAKLTGVWDVPEEQGRGRVFPVLQALDFEADHLIDSSGILRVLERGKVIALTRDYPYYDNQPDEQDEGISKQKLAKPEDITEASDRSEISKRMKMARASSHSSNTKISRSSSSRTVRGKTKGKDSTGTSLHHEHDHPPVQYRYEEYEQAPPSPWAQSPAPSPAIRHDPSENPFFTQSVDEDSFNPAKTPQDYTGMKQVEAIGIDRSWTVLHIPLNHVLLSKAPHCARLDAAATESRSKNISGADTERSHWGDQAGKKTPIAILSILTPIIPYPSNLRHSLEHLAPHLATTFSLCRHHSDLETQISGLSRKRPRPTGFGALANRGPLDRPHLFALEDQLARGINPGSLTSPSDYSGVSRSNAGSPMTPGWGPTSVGLTMDRRSGSGTSPSFSSTEGYFTPKGGKSTSARAETSSISGIAGSRQTSKESSTTDLKSYRNQPEEKRGPSPNTEFDIFETTDREGAERNPPEEDLSQTSRAAAERDSHDLSTVPEPVDINPQRQQTEYGVSPRRQAIRTASTQGQSRGERPHTQLHSYGADFEATYQTLPATTTTPAQTKQAAMVRPSRAGSFSGSFAGPVDMPPPSDRLKGLMLDSLPAHVFVALPQTGEIVWVNSRYLTYRGQTVAELYEDPWASIHPDERESYLKAWAHAVRTGEQFSVQVRIRRFDGSYRWFYTRAVGSRDTRGVIVQWYGSHMDIHDQHIAEVKAARQEEIEASEAKHRLLANLIPQVIFAATEDEGVTFANEQWLSYTGQKYEEALGLGFIDFVHPDDIAKCHVPKGRSSTPDERSPRDSFRKTASHTSSDDKSSTSASSARTETTVRGAEAPLSRQNSSSSESAYDLPTADLSTLAKKGVIKVSHDSNGRLSYTTEVRLRSKSGEYRWHLVRCVEIDDINFGSGSGSWFGACTDINDHKLVETKMKEAVESKSKFLSNMSHEIRTPLIGISGMVSFLQDTPLNEEQTDFVNTIQTSSNGLLMIINDILDMSKVDAGMMKLAYEWFHTRSLIEDVNELVSTMAITKKLELNYVIDEDVPAMVKGDKVRMRQVLLNVIGNAVKFTNEGEVFSSCKVYRDKDECLAENEVMLQFSVVDTGRGFTKEEKELIFKPFSQIDGSSTRQHGGSGLGLVISRQLVELHGGKMEGHAVPGKGSTFTFTVKFALPTEEDHPESSFVPQSTISTPSISAAAHISASAQALSPEVSAKALKQAGGNPMLANKLLQSPAVISPKMSLDANPDSPAANSSASSDPSVRSTRTFNSEKSSQSSVHQGLTHFSEAAKVSGQDLSTMKLAIPEKSSPETTPTGEGSRAVSRAASVSSTSSSRAFRPPIYSILVICPQKHSRQATKQHIEMIIPQDVPVKITAIGTVDEARDLIGGYDPIIFTHIILSLANAEDIISLMYQILASTTLLNTSIVILSDPVQRQAIMKMASEYDYDQLAKDNRVIFIYKPMKPSKFAIIFDPDKERDLSTDRNRSSAQQQVATQKQNYLDLEKKIGHKGYRILLVEDNMVNRKVLLKFLGKVGIDVEVATDGVECTEKVFSHPHNRFSLILCDLHMPRKDGYETCREIRQWEKTNNFPCMPIIALSANVMADVLERCVEAGFNNYVTKPVDFKALSQAMSDLLDRPDSSKQPEPKMRKAAE